MSDDPAELKARIDKLEKNLADLDSDVANLEMRIAALESPQRMSDEELNEVIEGALESRENPDELKK